MHYKLLNGCCGPSWIATPCPARGHRSGDRSRVRRLRPVESRCTCHRGRRFFQCQEPAARQRILDAANQVGSIWFARIAIIQALQRDRGNVVRRDFRPRFRKRSWSPEELTLLNKLVVAGASPGTAAEALNRTEETVRIKARMIGCPFPHRNEIKRRPQANRIVLVSSSDAT
jgi:hypothetical protein